MDSGMRLVIFVCISGTLLHLPSSKADFVYEVLPPVYNAGQSPPTPVYHPPYQPKKASTPITKTFIASQKPINSQTKEPSIANDSKPIKQSIPTTQPIFNKPSDQRNKHTDQKLNNNSPITKPISDNAPGSIKIHNIPKSSTNFKLPGSITHFGIQASTNHNNPLKITNRPFSTTRFIPVTTAGLNFPISTLRFTSQQPHDSSTYSLPKSSTTGGIPKTTYLKKLTGSTFTITPYTSTTLRDDETTVGAPLGIIQTSNLPKTSSTPTISETASTQKLPGSTTNYKLPVTKATLTPSTITPASIPLSTKKPKIRTTYKTKPTRRFKLVPKSQQPIYKPTEVPHDPNVVYNEKWRGRRGSEIGDQARTIFGLEEQTRTGRGIGRRGRIEEDSSKRTPYSFQYRINNKGPRGSKVTHSETSDGDEVSGSFSLRVSNSHHHSFTYFFG